MRELAEHARIPIVFTASVVFDVDDGWGLHERALEQPFTKDYDLLESPIQWARQWDTTRWGLLAAFDGEERVGGCIVAHDTPGLDMLGGRADVAVVWDLRVAPAFRGRGVGAGLIAAAESWALQRRCVLLRVETQNVNPQACRFYSKCGFTLAKVDRFAYPSLPGEVQLVWERAVDLEGAR